MEEKRKPSGRPTGENVGANLRKRSIGLADFTVCTPNLKTFKSTQLRLQGWVAPNPEASQEDYDKVLASTKFRIKRMVSAWSKTYRFFQPECIIDIETSDVTRHSKKKPHQFFKVDIVLYTRDDLEYSKYLVTTTTQSLAENVMEILADFPEYWNFTINDNWSKRKKANV